MAHCILRTFDEGIAAEAKRRGMTVMVSDRPSTVEFDKALVVAAGTPVPWELVKHGLFFVERWDAASPLWRYNVLAETQGTEAERKLTRSLTLDLRVPLYACECLFVDGRRVVNGHRKFGRELLAAWEDEVARGPEPRLAFLRAVARVKPRLCTLPATWLGLVRIRRGKTLKTRPETAVMRRAAKPAGLVRVEVAPGQFVQCRPENAEAVRKRYAELRTRLRGR